MKDKIFDFLKGCCIGVAMIIPGVSGGTIAVLLNMYDKMITAISSLRKDFKNSFLYLLPIGLGLVCAFAIMYYPLKLALEHIPFQTTMVFLGLMIGSTPKIIIDATKNGFKKIDVLSILIPLCIVIGICFIPGMGDVNLGVNMHWSMYIFVFLIAILASCALVVPGISGSMLLLIFGFYQPILNLISDLKTTPLHSIVVLLIFIIGLVIGFLTISKLMKFLLTKYNRITNWCIVGFVIGSLPALLIQFNYSKINDSLTIWVSVILCIVFTILSYLLTSFMDKKINSKKENNVESNQTQNINSNN